MNDERLRSLVHPSHTAVVTTGVQRDNVTGRSLPALAAAISANGTITAMARVCDAARVVGARVVHCTLENRPDRVGLQDNCPIFAAHRRDDSAPVSLTSGTPGAELTPELGPDPRDVVVTRFHGLTPFPGTTLDQTLRNLGITTVVATGVSVNINLMGLVLNAADLGYCVVVVRDAVAGAPDDYVQAVFDNTFRLVATVTSSEQLLSVWSAADTVAAS